MLWRFSGETFLIRENKKNLLKLLPIFINLVINLIKSKKVSIDEN